MILDTSALVALFFKEPDARRFAERMNNASVLRMSVASYVELAMVVEGRLGTLGLERADAFFQEAGIILEPVTVEQGTLARQAFHEFGKGRHRAALNFGDCFSYALAKALGEPLLFKGNDFSHTDIAVA